MSCLQANVLHVTRSLVEHWLLNRTAFAGPLVPPVSSSEELGVGTPAAEGRTWLDTLLGPEETDRAGPLRRACCLFDLVRDRPSVTSAWVLSRVSGGGCGSVAVCCLRFA